MKIKKILISQPEPADLEKSPYRNLVRKLGVNLTFFKFFEVVGIPASEFRKTRIHIGEYSAIIFNSKNSIDHFFRMLKELRETVSEDMKYFCSTEAIALYLQNYIQYRKRKVFYGNQYFSDLIEILSKHRDEKFLFPCSDEKQTEYTKALDKAKFKYTKAPMYTSKPRNLTQFDIDSFDAIALFSPIGVRSLVKNFPDIKEHTGILIAAFGTSTHAALKEHGIKLSIVAPTQSAPSMAMALENYILGKEQDSVVTSKGEYSKHGMKNTITAGKKTKPVIANKEIYKQRMEEKKAQAAARRAARAAEKARLEAAEKAKAEAAEKAAAEKAKKAAAEKAKKAAAEKAKKVAVVKAAPKSAPAKPKEVAAPAKPKKVAAPAKPKKVAATKTTKPVVAKAKKSTTAKKA